MASDAENVDIENGEELPSIKDDVVVTKYKMAADMVNTILKKLIAQSNAGVSVLSICEAGDKMIEDETGKVFKKDTEMKKGIAFPTCVSVNNCVCHYSPAKSDAELLLCDGDVVKVDLGAHIDGFIAVAAHTFVVGASKENKVTGRKADVIMAAHLASEAALRLVKDGLQNVPVTAAIQKISESYECKPIEGMLSHQLEQNIIDGKKSIIQNPPDAKDKKKPYAFDGEKNQAEDAAKQWGHSKKDHDVCTFNTYEVYAIDVLVSSGEGKGKDLGQTKTTVYKKLDTRYNLKMKASKQFFSEVEKKHQCMPFTLRALEEESKARLGVKECVEHNLVEPYAVLYEKEGEVVAQFKFTVLLLPNGPLKITGVDFDSEMYESSHSVEDEEMKALLATSASRKTQKKNKKKAVQAVAQQAEQAESLPELEEV